MIEIAYLPGRGVVEVAGEDRVSFLQGLVSNDVTGAAPGRAVWAALLSPQGKWLADFFILADAERLLLDCARDQAPMIAQKLSRFRLRAKVSVRDASAEWHVHAVWGGVPQPTPGNVFAADPRLSDAGWRILANAPMAADGTAAWDSHRLALGLPDPCDMETDKTVLLEAGFDELNGVSWTKGCYMGQELTARTKYRGLIKRRLVPVTISGPPPAPGSILMRDGIEVGVMRSSQGAIGLATMRLEALAQPVVLEGTALTPSIPGWMRLG